METVGTEPFFNLVDEPWVRILASDGREVDLSMRETFHRAAGLAVLAGELPTQAFAILRILLAVLHRAVDGPKSVDHWAELRDDWDEVVQKVDAYLDRWHEHFWLQHPVRPFMQVAGLRTAKDEIFSLSRIICDGAGTSAFLSTRLGENLEAIPWSEAARWVIHTQAYDVAGIHSGAVGDPRVKNGKGFGIGTGWAGQIGGVYAEGDTLKETLLLNLIAASGEDASSDSDLPVWERPPLTALPEEWMPGSDDQLYRDPIGPVDLYTWPSRRLRLFGDEQNITGVVNAQGDRISPQNRFREEPMSVWRFSEPQTKKFGEPTYMPLRHDPARAFWRGLGGLLPKVVEQQQSTRRPPAVMDWLARLQISGLLRSSLVRLHAVGMSYGSNEAVYDEMFSDTMTLPAALLDQQSEGLDEIAVDAVRCAQDAVYVLGSLAQNLAASSGASTESDGPRQRVSGLAYAALDQRFREWVTTLNETCRRLECRDAWHREVREVVEAIGNELVDTCGPAALVGRWPGGQFRDAGLSLVWFRKKLRNVIPQAYTSEGQNENEAERLEEEK